MNTLADVEARVQQATERPGTVSYVDLYLDPTIQTVSLTDPLTLAKRCCIGSIGAPSEPLCSGRLE